MRNEASSCSALYSLALAAAGGLLAMAVTGRAGRMLDLLVNPEQKRRDRQVREGTAHDMAGPYFAARITGRELGEAGKRRARMVFSVAYGIGWGLIYAGVRKKVPAASRLAGVPFAIPFFLACDGVMAPLLGISPSLRHVPWQPSVKELANHMVWTASAELVHRGAGRVVSAARQT